MNDRLLLYLLLPGDGAAHGQSAADVCGIQSSVGPGVCVFESRRYLQDAVMVLMFTFISTQSDEADESVVPPPSFSLGVPQFVARLVWKQSNVSSALSSQHKLRHFPPGHSLTNWLPAESGGALAWCCPPASA
ncbi:unnamed protein product [Pleuronectes platessa]|uniref:Uncharacterized protein n=1 Tax=Pleuronectes platessa TaxID=8262 RepID=A0A9N7YDA3_PLEPL|nr:unnamed protein product [Pleuronectes platessa]